MKKKWYSLANRCLSALLVLLGFQGCTKEPVTCEYGTPSVDYHVIGQVTDADGHAVKGIRVTMEDIDAYNNQDDKVTFTDENGNFKTKTFNAMFIESEGTVVFEDVDGSANGGEFATTSMRVGDLPKKQVKKSDRHWYDGEYELTANTKLDKK